MKIEQSMIELNGIFTDLAEMVQEQDPMIQHIDQHISASVSAVQHGVVNLRQGAGYQKSSRKLMCIMFIVLAVFIGIIVLFLVVGLSVFRDRL